LRENYTRKEVMQNIFNNPFKRFGDMGFIKRSRDIEYVEFNSHIWKNINKECIVNIIKLCDKALDEYFNENMG